MLHLDYRDSRPIYEQVQEALRRQMMAGLLTEGEKLPSVRTLASQLAINPNTIQRAYEALERDGYVYTVAGKGSFVAPRGDIEQERRNQLLQTFEKTAQELLFLGETPESLSRYLEKLKGGSQS